MALLRHFATVGGLTGISRLLGFARDVLMAAVLGTGPVADAFFVAFRLPNVFRRLVAEGAFNAAFVPVFARTLEADGRPPACRLAEEVLAVLLAAVAALTLAAVAGMPWLMQVLAPGFADDPAKFDTAVLLTRLTFPYLLFMALVMLYGGILNSLYRYAAFAAAPIVLNVCFLVALAAVVPVVGDAGPVLAWTVTLAGIAQFVLLVAVCHRAGIRLHLPLPRVTEGVRRTLRLMGPGVLSAGALQLNLLVGTMIASLQAGAVSYLYYADRVYQLPLGLIGIALGVVLLPDLSRTLRAGDAEGARDRLNRGLELAMLLGLPAAAALIAVPTPIVGVLFERGAFAGEATQATAAALMAFAVGVPAFIGVKILQPAFFAREDTMSPFKAAAAGSATNIALAIGLFSAIGHEGIALATALASWLESALLAAWLYRAGHLRPDARLKARLPRMLLATLGMAGTVSGAASLLAPLLTAGPARAVPALAALVLAGMAVYGGLALALGAARMGELRGLLRRRAAADTGPA
ncbi:putative peptidoglycan lipid II flippase [Limimonas halophila]|uniref:Probable lipid II flippase MurJ n=1 Tax=Limimonas halophila TaxID=1082479 RepID=A0A1G7S6B1_9PROT|nr:murein biosynthesis integral membrane protein MurJ [Limimonas halophila]SDG18521.1 putative peptidoglycan lipid II flippase [Limimonas halophila]